MALREQSSPIPSTDVALLQLSSSSSPPLPTICQIIPNLDGIGEPLNLIVSGESDASVLTVEGFLLWVTSINFGVSCLGQANGTQQSANLGYGDQIQGTGDGNNGVLRWNYYSPYIGTCKETVQGGNHFRWFKQQDSNAYFLAASVELSLDTSHMIAQNGYNNGRDRIGTWLRC